MDGFRGIHFSHVERVAVGVLAAHCEVHGLYGIESQAGALVVEVNLLNWRLPS